MSQDILMNAQESINSIEDMKVKLHADNAKLTSTVEDLDDKHESIQNNIKILEVQNEKITS